MTIQFKLKDYQKKLTPSKQKETPIYLLASYGYFDVLPDETKKYRRLKYYVGHSINPSQWEKKTKNGKEIETEKVIDHPNHKNINKDIKNLREIVEDLIDNNKDKSPEVLRDLIREKLNPSPMSEAKTLLQYMDARIKELETTNTAGLSPGTIRAHKSFVNIFKEFAKHMNKVYDFNDIDLRFYNVYTDYLYSVRNYKDNTVGNHIKNLKIYMSLAKDDKLHTNLTYSHKDFKKKKSDSYQIALTQLEVDSLFNLDLSNDKEAEIYRDVFLAGCYTAQRFSDYSRINKKMINGNLIKLTQQKTGAEVVIPMNLQLEEILEKYNYNLPKVREQDLNYNIKLIARKAKITSIVNWVERVRNKSIEKEAEKCTLVTSHTARRTGATLMYEAELRLADIMSFTGHKKETQLRTYLKLDKEKIARKAHDHEFFKREVEEVKS